MKENDDIYGVQDITLKRYIEQKILKMDKVVKRVLDSIQIDQDRFNRAVVLYNNGTVYQMTKIMYRDIIEKQPDYENYILLKQSISRILKGEQVVGAVCAINEIKKRYNV